HLLVLHSFPTRRSSDLEERDGPHGGVVLQRLERRQQVLLHGSRNLVDRFVFQIESDDGYTVIGELPRERRPRSHQRRSSTMAKPDRKSTRLNSSHVAIS